MQFYSDPIPSQLQTNYLDELYATVHFTSPATELIHLLKFKSYWSLAEPIAEIMTTFLPMSEKLTLLTSIPLHKQREWDRGFNQSEKIAEFLSRKWKVKRKKLLIRKKATTPQAELNREKRLTHVQNAFIYQSKVNLQNEVVGLVDDVSTTGTTLNECAKVLKEHGAKKVIGIVFAHGK